MVLTNTQISNSVRYTELHINIEIGEILPNENKSIKNQLFSLTQQQNKNLT